MTVCIYVCSSSVCMITVQQLKFKVSQNHSYLFLFRCLQQWHYPSSEMNLSHLHLGHMESQKLATLKELRSSDSHYHQEC